MSEILKIIVRSFSYKNGIPIDESGNGGGFVFDCRGILNPGRIQEYKTKTGRDAEVIQYLESETKISEFLNGTFQVVDLTIEDFLERNFTNLEINFGCTGGQHRSVYSDDQMTEHIKNKFPKAEVKVEHLVQESKNWINESY